jgi:hypothetical protein
VDDDGGEKDGIWVRSRPVDRSHVGSLKTTKSGWYGGQQAQKPTFCTARGCRAYGSQQEIR